MNDGGEDDIWVSKEDWNSDDDEFWEPKEPAFFRLGLTPKGERGEYHVRRGGDQKPRAAIPSFDSGSKGRPAFRVSSEAKLIVHGNMDEDGEELATLLVHDFSFLTRGPGRFTDATIQLRFKSLDERNTGPLVRKVAPFGLHNMAVVSSGEGVDGADMRQQVGGCATVRGMRPLNEWGDSVEAEWRLELGDQGRQQGSGGIPWRIRTCVLLKRDSDDDFGLVPFIKAQPNLRALPQLKTGNLDDKPIVYDPEFDPFNELEKDLGIDRWNLGSVDLDSVWGWDFRRPEGI